MCLDPARLNYSLIRPVGKGPTISDILPKLAKVMYEMVIGANCGYHTLKMDDKSSYITTFT